MAVLEVQTNCKHFHSSLGPYISRTERCTCVPTESGGRPVKVRVRSEPVRQLTSCVLFGRLQSPWPSSTTCLWDRRLLATVGSKPSAYLHGSARVPQSGYGDLFESELRRMLL